MKWITEFFYPPECMHCQLRLTKQRTLLCSSCINDIALVRPKERCHKCLSPFESRIKRCIPCMEKPIKRIKSFALFENIGPAESILRYATPKTLGALLYMLYPTFAAPIGNRRLVKGLKAWQGRPFDDEKIYLVPTIHSRDDLFSLTKAYPFKMKVLALAVSY